MLAALSIAEKIANDEGATQDAVNQATQSLNSSVADLISIANANTTLLYEAVQAATITDKDSYTPKTWAAYSSAKTEAETLLATMFKDGQPTEHNKASAQSDVEAAAERLRNAQAALDERQGEYGKSKAAFYHAVIEYLAKKFDPDKLSGYTEASLSALRTARDAALAAAEAYPASTDIGNHELFMLGNAEESFRQACYQLKDSGEEQISVRFSAVDATGAYTGKHENSANTTTLTLAANTTVGAVLDQFRISTSLTYNDNYPLVFVNGELYFGGGGGYFGEQFRNIVLHDGDELTVVHFRPKMETYSSGAGQYPALMDDVRDWFHYSVISAPQTVQAGQPFTITVTADGALPQNRTGAASPVSGAAVYTSAAFEDKADAGTADVLTPAYVSTGADGTSQITLYAEGWTAVNAFRLDDEGRYTVGPTVLVYVTPADDLRAIKAQLREELDEAYYDETYPESTFTAENWKTLTNAYHAGVSDIASAETSGAAREAQMTALQTIKQMQQEADSSNRSNLETFRKLLSELPEDVSKLDLSAKEKVDRLKAAYEAMTDYQRDELTARERTRYQQIVSQELGEAVEYKLTLEHTFSGVPEADRQALQAMIDHLTNASVQEDYNNPEKGLGPGGDTIEPLFRYQVYNPDERLFETKSASPALRTVDLYINSDYTAYLPARNAQYSGQIRSSQPSSSVSSTGDGWSITYGDAKLQCSGLTAKLDGHLTYMVNDHAYEIRSITVDGVTDYSYRGAGFYDWEVYAQKTTDHCNMVIPNAKLEFKMPFNDVKITVTWGPVGGSSDEVEKARTDALTALEAVFEKYDETHEHYAAIKAAYEKGVSDIRAAATVDAINTVRRDAAKAIEKAAAGSTGTDDTFMERWGDSESNKGFYAGNPVGTVTVIVENTTYSGAPEGFYSDPNDPDYSLEDAIVYEPKYTIGDEDSMMTVILRALADNGYEWSGTGGSKFGITYLSSISLGGLTESKLGEFDGGNESGWMGTLNGFFVNLSFAEFTVKQNSNTDIQLSDGDVIHVMYTCTGLGEDLGGTFYNSDTTLKALKVMDGDETLVLAPEFEAVAEPGGTYSYTVMIDGDAAELTITADAANKNYLVKRFLNEKVTDNTEGGNYYKSTQAIPVVSGDTIYIGCGEPVWPSMNNQSTEAREYVGTWYELHIVSANSGSSEVDAQIDALPGPGDLTYENRENYRQDIVQAKKAIDALADSSSVSEDRKQKLEDLCTKLAGFDAVDEVKAAIAALPSVSNATLNDETAINAAKTKYDALAELQSYLKGAEKQKLEALLARMSELKEALFSSLTVTPDTVAAVKNGSTIRLIGSAKKGSAVQLNGETVTDGQTFQLGGGLYYETYRIDMSGITWTDPGITLAEKVAEVKVAEDATLKTQAAASAVGTSNNTTSKGLTAAAAETLTDTAAKKAEEAEKTVEDGQKVEVKAEVKLDIVVKDYTKDTSSEAEKTVLELDITPKVTYTTTVTDTSGQKVGEPTVSEPEKIDNEDIKAPVTISVALPTDMPTEDLYIKHFFSDGSGYEYIKPTIKNGVATWQQSSFSTVQIMQDERKVTLEGGILGTLTPDMVDKDLPAPSVPGKDFIGWTFEIDGTEYPGGPFTKMDEKLFDALFNALSKGTTVNATANYKDHPSGAKSDSPNKPKTEPAKADASKFRDISTSDWHFDAVQYVLEKGLMNGTSDWTFAPNDATTRGMIVTILARVEDVNTAGDPWYAAGQKWAIANGISDGTNMPGVITREQLATILFRYAKSKGRDVSRSAALTGFVDSDKVSSYALDAMQWAVAEELLQGSNGKLDPQGSATRAQVATILMRFMQRFEK